MGTMMLDRARRNAQGRGHFLVGLALHDQLEQLTLTWGQLRQESACGGHLLTKANTRRISGQFLVDHL